MAQTGPGVEAALRKADGRRNYDLRNENLNDGESCRAVQKQAGCLLYKNWILTVFIPMGLSLQQRQQRTLLILGIMESPRRFFHACTREPVLRRFWYPVLPVEQLVDGPQSFQLLGQPWCCG